MVSKIPAFSSPYPVRPWLLTVVLFFAAILLGYLFFIERNREGDGRLIGPLLRDEYVSIDPPEKTQLVGEPKQIFKSHLASVAGDYSSSLPIPALKHHYNEKLASRGWVFLRDEATTGLSKSVSWYCKGEFEAFFEVSNQPWLTYSFGVRWDSSRKLGRGACSSDVSRPVGK